MTKLKPNNKYRDQMDYFADTDWSIFVGDTRLRKKITISDPLLSKDRRRSRF